MSLIFDETPGWEFEIYEKSAGVYMACGKNGEGVSVVYEGTDPDQILERCKEYAKTYIESL